MGAPAASGAAEGLRRRDRSPGGRCMGRTVSTSEADWQQQCSGRFAAASGSAGGLDGAAGGGARSASSATYCAALFRRRRGTHAAVGRCSCEWRRTPCGQVQGPAPQCHHREDRAVLRWAGARGPSRSRPTQCVGCLPLRPCPLLAPHRRPSPCSLALPICSCFSWATSRVAAPLLRCSRKPIAGDRRRRRADTHERAGSTVRRVPRSIRDRGSAQRGSREESAGHGPSLRDHRARWRSRQCASVPAARAGAGAPGAASSQAGREHRRRWRSERSWRRFRLQCERRRRWRPQLWRWGEGDGTSGDGEQLERICGACPRTWQR